MIRNDWEAINQVIRELSVCSWEISFRIKSRISLLDTGIIILRNGTTNERGVPLTVLKRSHRTLIKTKFHNRQRAVSPFNIPIRTLIVQAQKEIGFIMGFKVFLPLINVATINLLVIPAIPIGMTILS